KLPLVREYHGIAEKILVVTVAPITACGGTFSKRQAFNMTAKYCRIANLIACLGLAFRQISSLGNSLLQPHVITRMRGKKPMVGRLLVSNPNIEIFLAFQNG